MNPNLFFSFGHSPEYPTKNPGISFQKVWFPWVSKDIPNFLAPTPSRGRPPPHPARIFGQKKVWVWVPFASLKLITGIRGLLGEELSPHKDIQNHRCCSLMERSFHHTRISKITGFIRMPQSPLGSGLEEYCRFWRMISGLIAIQETNGSF